MGPCASKAGRSTAARSAVLCLIACKSCGQSELERERERERERVGVVRPVNQCGYIRAMRERERERENVQEV